MKLISKDWIDIHRHFTHGLSDLEDLERQLDRDGIATTVLFGFQGLRSDLALGTQDEQVLEAARLLPGRVVPFICDFDPTSDHAVEYVENHLRTSEFRGIGEILVGHSVARNNFSSEVCYDHPVLKEVYALAARHKVPVLVHVDPPFQEEFRRAMAFSPETIFIWAHAGYDFLAPWGGRPMPTSFLRDLIKSYANLYFDISTWMVSPLVMATRDWIELLSDNSERFLFGSDMTDAYSMKSSWIKGYSDLVRLLDPHARENVLRKNAEKVLKGGLCGGIQIQDA